MKNSEISYTCL